MQSLPEPTVIVDLPADTPAWFLRALDLRPEHREIEVAGATIHYRAWGTPTARPVVLVHGGGAHSGWWDHVAPLIGGRTIALDLSGHGDSAWRESYSLAQWAEEVAAVIAAEQLDQPVVVGHSMGGWVGVALGVHHSASLRSLLVIDSPLNDQPPEEQRLRERRRPTRVYPSADDAITRFRTLPEQAVLLPYIVANVAGQSMRAVGGGWTWKFDPNLFGRQSKHHDLLPNLTLPMVLIRCEHGLVSAEMATRIIGLHPEGIPVVELPDAGHHPMFDQPLSLVTAIRTVLATLSDTGGSWSAEGA
jgi:pimeloyl-ACP methyl ester carboxylesterase